VDDTTVETALSPLQIWTFRFPAQRKKESWDLYRLGDQTSELNPAT